LDVNNILKLLIMVHHPSESPATSEETEQFGSSVALVHPLFEVTDTFQLAPEIQS
jgi:hypothetical protein